MQEKEEKKQINTGRIDMSEYRIPILGDSRTFDTYYYNSTYGERYGYNKTFPFLLQKMMRSNAGKNSIEVVHIPDHFRSQSIENNILRLALIDPAMIILCNGIWETLVNKELFINYAVDKIKAHSTHDPEELALTYSSRVLVDLFKLNKLAQSPKKYIDSQRRIVSYFRRRQRRCVLMNLPVPPPSHLDRLHYAGNYKCLPEWGECLQVLNKELEVLSKEYDIAIVDTHRLIVGNGGFGKNLIDQWHFSTAFHKVLAHRLNQLIRNQVDLLNLPTSHISHRFMLHRDVEKESVVVYGNKEMVEKWIRSHPYTTIEAFVEKRPTEAEKYKSVRLITLADVCRTKSRIILLAMPESSRQALEIRVLRNLPNEKILLYPEELQSSYYESMKGM